MRRRDNQTWVTRGRYGLVILVTLVAAQNGAVHAGGSALSTPVGVAVLCGAALLARRAHWLTAPALATAATVLWGWTMLPLLLVALFDLAAHRRTGAAVACAAAALAGNALVEPDVGLWLPQQYGSPLFLLLAVMAGLWMGNRRRLVTALSEQVEHLRVERELRERAARAAERSAIAAEMHDVLAHRLSLIALHTGVLSTREKTLPAPVAERLALLRAASTEALADLRDVLGALRCGSEAHPAAPEPVLRDVRELAEQARAAGQCVALTVEGRPDGAPAAHRLAVFRLVQEALTNARKHAAGAPVAVRVDYGPPATFVEVTNAPGDPAPPPVPSGYGMVGLRERVTALGGHLSAGPGGAGAWRLVARIPHPTPSEQNGSRT
ncbi:sensor histidine kinase [Streptomyces marincola]|uniref:sensor histidine kinase n=1 Tax=Streptomyces marincola TaxID=2878388 RepID=UPI001CF31B55|nr:sensor histidine kinase [Streptomyces marincola]UCM87899.1 histidine kinase [Streptomyces marincola]